MYGDSNASAVYIPATSSESPLSDLQALDGTVVSGATTVLLQEFSSRGALTLYGFTRVTLQGSVGADQVALALDDSSGENRLSGTGSTGAPRSCPCWCPSPFP